ncbi:unnamed protein product [Clonostachys byssicola]|uniref:Uncharacterized protein n=1 Tax=Clonostachys byssicola TaxID=160290 RepID=A0A9N9YCT8_9HYPO|nr:unnamed protein product [Clonostachys byssicola]
MSNIIDDVKSGLKGIKGAGDTLRGSLMEAADQTFEPNQQHPSVVARNEKHRATAEKGKMDVEGADAMVSRHEWNRKDRATQRQAAATMPEGNQATAYDDPIPRAEAPGTTVPATAGPGMAAHGIAAPAVPPSQVAEETTAPAVAEGGIGRTIPSSQNTYQEYPQDRVPRKVLKERSMRNKHGYQSNVAVLFEVWDKAH